MQEKMEEVGI